MKTLYISIDNAASSKRVMDAIVALLDDTTLDTIGKVKLHRVTVMEHNGSNGSSRCEKARWQKE